MDTTRGQKVSAYDDKGARNQQVMVHAAGYGTRYVNRLIAS
jgi:hypothetical protein